MAGADVISPADFNLEGSRYFFLIDPEFYSAQVSGFDSNDKKVVREHYDNIGWKLGLDPSNLFDTSAYLEANPDIAAQNINPLEHYVTKGMAEYRGFGATAGIEGYILDITSGAPQVEIDLIKDGLQIAQTFADTYLGGGISAEIRKNVTVKIDYTGLGNQEPGGGGSNATGLSVINDLLPRPYFDVGHEQWTNRFTNNGKWSLETAGLLTIVHEYIHGWQNFLGAHTVYQQPLGNWISEGIAEYLAYEAMIKLDRIDATDAVHSQISATAFTGEANYALSQIDTSSTPIWVGHIGHVAIDWLMDETGSNLTKLRIIHEKIAEGKNTFTAFSETFGLSLDSFYTQFEQWRPLFLKDPAEALNARPDLILANETSIEGNNTDEIFTTGDTNDTIREAGGDDIINGGAGIDTAKYSGEVKNFTIKINTGTATTVTDLNGGEGTDSLTNIEILSFSD